MHSFFLNPDQIERESAVLEGREARHAKNVLRLKAGDEVRLVDGAGFEYAARVVALSPGRVELAVTTRQAAPGRPRLKLTVAQGFLKEKKMDRLVRQLSEAGAARLVPFVSERAVARPASERFDRRRERWTQIAIEALKQCRRGDLLEVEPALDFEAVLARRASVDLGFFFWENADAPLALERPPSQGGAPAPTSVLAVLGPEGGFTDAEARAAAEAGFRLARLGPRILRAETAAVAAGVLIQYLFGDLGSN